MRFLVPILLLVLAWSFANSAVAADDAETPIEMPLSLYIVDEAGPSPTSELSSRRDAASMESTITALDVITVANEGGELEGHTPTAFAGMGTGLFAGDNLNAGFPEGVGVQTYLTFVLPPGIGVASAQLTCNALRVSGTPFEDLGLLVAEPVTYDFFGPELFDLAAIGPPSGCTVVDETSIRCDVTEAVRAAVDADETAAQLRIRFEVAADSDGRQDLALFYRTDSNTNEAGIFELAITQNP